MQSAAGFFFAFIAVLALIGLATWLVRRFAGNRLGTGANRGRMPRLAVVDAAAVDGRRRLVLVRRDNIEHLLMIGGPSDIVVEPNIVRATPPQQQMPPRAPLPPAAEQAWSDSEPFRPEPLEHDEPAPLPEPPPRPARPAFAEEMRRAAAAGAARRSDRRHLPRTDDAAGACLARGPPRAMPRAEPPPLAPAPRASGAAEGCTARSSGRAPCRSSGAVAGIGRRQESRRDGAAARGRAAPSRRQPGCRRSRAAGRARRAVESHRAAAASGGKRAARLRLRGKRKARLPTRRRRSSRTSKTRWQACSAAQRRLREVVGQHA